MIKCINTIKNISSRTLNSIRKYVLNNNIFSVKLAPPLEKDVFVLSAKNGMPEVLMKNPGIIEGSFDAGIKDYRLKFFNTVYRAYNFEGYDNMFPNNYICIDSKGQRRIKPHVFLSYVEIDPEYARQGAYKNAIKNLVTIVKENEECEGRIILNARKIERNGAADIPSPSLAHWKCGFRFANENDNKIMQKVLEGKLPPEDAPEGYMYYAFL